jgi:hypothetical protein
MFLYFRVSDETVSNDIQEEMAVALSHRIELLEDEKLKLTQINQEYKRKLEQYQMLVNIDTSNSLGKTNSQSVGKSNLSLTGLGLSSKDKKFVTEENESMKRMLTETIKLNQELEIKMKTSTQEITRLKSLVALKDRELQANTNGKEQATTPKGNTK